MRVVLNADMVESFGSWVKGNDEALLDIISSANNACGFHAGDPDVMAKTIKLAKQSYEIPIFAYQVSGEYAMLAQGIENGIFDKKNILIETISCFKRAGCNGILTYYAYEIAKLLTYKYF